MVQQSSVESKELPTQLSCPQTRPDLQSASESQSPSPSPHLFEDEQQLSSPWHPKTREHKNKTK